MTEAAARTALVDAGRRLLAEGLVARSWGNLSLRLDDETMLVTPSGILWPDVTKAMLSRVDLATGEWTGAWKPSGERKVHREIYRRRPEVGAVVHTHQSAASVCAAARVSVPWGTDLVACAPYALPGTKALTQGTVDALGCGAAVLMANHGSFAVGATLDEAFERILSLETTCADAIARATTGLPARADVPWDSRWLVAVETCETEGARLSTAPFTVAWSKKGRPLRALLDDLAQLAGAQVNLRSSVPRRLGGNDVVLVQDRGAVVAGPDAEALAMVVEKACRAALGGEGLGGARAFPRWEATLMRLVYRNAYAKQAARSGQASA